MSHWITMLLSIAIGIVGLFLISGAKDDGMYVAGLLLVGFGLLFSFSRIAALTDFSEPQD